MKFLAAITRPEFSWFDLLFVAVAFALAREFLPPALQTLAFFAIGAVIGAEHAWLRPAIAARARQAITPREDT